MSARTREYGVEDEFGVTLVEPGGLGKGAARDEARRIAARRGASVYLVEVGADPADPGVRMVVDREEVRPPPAARQARRPVAAVRVLRPEEYPREITAPRGAYTPEVRFAALHPEGMYHVEHQGAGHHMAYFTPRRRGSRARTIGGAGDLAGALRRISQHEDELLNPDAPREQGRTGPVSIFALGRRTAGRKPPTELDAEIEAYLRGTGQGT